ncbi:unnamed protein product [Ectocarpus sp. 6 AP-2014]
MVSSKNEANAHRVHKPSEKQKQRAVAVVSQHRTQHNSLTNPTYPFLGERETDSITRCSTAAQPIDTRPLPGSPHTRLPKPFPFHKAFLRSHVAMYTQHSLNRTNLIDLLFIYLFFCLHFKSALTTLVPLPPTRGHTEEPSLPSPPTVPCLRY